MLRQLFHKKGRILRTALPLFDYLVAGVSNPRLFFTAFRYLSRSKVENVLMIHNARARAKSGKKNDGTDSYEKVQILSESVGVLELERDETVISIGVSRRDFLKAILELHAAIPGSKLWVNNDQLRPRSPDFARAVLKAKLITITFSDLSGDESHIKIEPYRKREPGKWISPNMNNLTMRAVHSDVLDSPGYHLAENMLPAPPLHIHSKLAPVDVVITWVNHDDPEWKRLFDLHSGGASERTTETNSDARALSRFNNNHEIRYALRSVAKNLPWVRKIFIASNCQPPDWLDLSSQRLVWVDHSEFIPKHFLPTFNSHVIESFLHAIPDLSERFIYLNDDMFVTSRLNKSDFFLDNGLSLSRLEGYGMVSGDLSTSDPDYLNASRNSAQLLGKHFGIAPTQLHQHVPYALTRSTLMEVEDCFFDEIEKFRSNAFRGLDDLNIPSFLYHHYAILTRQAIESKKDSIMVKNNDLRWRERMRRAYDERYAFVCLNEGGKEEPSSSWKSAVQEFMTHRFDEPAKWELWEN